MNADRFQRMEAIFADAMARPAGERDRFVAARCGDDGQLLDEMRSLIEAATGSGAFDDLHAEFVEEIRAPAEGAGAAGDLAGLRVGRYRLVREIGRGGMGAVYLAERADGEFEQRVAVKLLRHDFATDELRHRFVTERQILARIDHPNIARLLDGGVTDDGRPFIVMEFVDGVRMDRYCHEHRLPVSDRLALFLAVCNAVQHVHRHLVVHRDIKPGNVFVTPDGTPKLLDFGIAKLLDPDAFGVEEPVTRTALRFLTPEYASPEQIRHESVTTASDVYQLGVLLFELLTGQRPFRFDRRAAGEVEAIIANTLPPRPSDVITQSSPDTPISNTFGIPRDRLRRQLAGDLDNIVLKALRKEPDRRYGSVGELVDDLERHQTGLPVTARPDSVGYRFGKFARRNRGAVAAAAALFAALGTFAVHTSLQSARIARERDVAQRMTTMLTDLFSTADPRFASDTITVGAFLDRGAQRVESDLGGDPETQVAMMNVLAEIYYHLAQPDDAERLASQAYEVGKAALGEGARPVANSATVLSKVRINQGRGVEGEALAREALSIVEQAGLRNTEHMAGALEQLAYALQTQGKLDSAATVHRRAILLHRSLAVQDTLSLSTSMLNLGWTELTRGDPRAARSQFRDALRLREQQYGPESPATAQIHSAIAETFRVEGVLDTALWEAERSSVVLERWLDPPHNLIADNLSLRAQILAAQERHAESDSLFEAAIAMNEEIYGADAPRLARLANDYALAAETRGDLARAEELYRNAVSRYRTGFGSEHGFTAVVESNLAGVLMVQGKRAEAASLLSRATETLLRSDVDSTLAAQMFSNHGEILLAEGDAQGAGDKFKRAVDLWLTKYPPDHNGVLRAQTLRGVALTRLGHFELAESVLRVTLERQIAKHGPDHPYTRGTRARTIQLYEAWGRDASADSLRLR